MNDGGGSTIHASISGGVTGQVVVGNHNVQHLLHASGAGGVTPAERADLEALVSQLRSQVAAAAPPEQRQLALDRVDELEQEVAAGQPDLNKLDYVKLWFAGNLPRLAGLVTGILVHPVLGKIVDSAGDALASEYRRRFEVPAT